MLASLAMADDREPTASEPGAPVPKDAIDPDLVSLRPRTQVGLLTAFSVVAFCIYLAIRLWPDFGFAGEGEARDVSVEAIVAGQVEPESYVAVRAELERAGAVRVHKAPGFPGLRIAPVAGTGDALWLALDGRASVRPREEPIYRGRLRRLSDLPFEEPFRSYLRAAAPPRFVTTDELRRARDAGELAAVTGDRFTATPDDEIELVVPDPDAVTLVVSYNERLPDLKAWQPALAATGLVDPGAAPAREDDGQAWFDVRRPGAHANAARALEDAGLWGARVEPITRSYRAPWREVTLDERGVTLAGTTVPWTSIDVVAVHADRRLPADPWILLTDESPDAYWYVRPLYVLIALFGALFLWALVRTARRELLAPKVPTRA